jgi:aryl-alcohol dehydrogenase-like predicted oxidoreductase
LAALGRPAYITLGRDADLGTDRSVAAMERRTHAMLDLAYQEGLRYFDAARSYGRAEEFLATWLDARRLEPGDVTIGSKWGYTYVGGWDMRAATQEVKDHSLATLRTQWGQTTDLLGDRLSLYQVHSATLESGVLHDRAVLGELLRLRDRNVAVGLTVSGPKQSEVIRTAMEVEIDGANPFSSVQATWNLFEPSAAGALAEAHDRGWGVIIKEALANGRLTDHASDPPPPPLRLLAQRLAVPVDRVAMAAATSQPWADVALSGAVTPSELASNVGALGLVVDEDLLAGLAEDPTDYWSRRAALPWS